MVLEHHDREGGGGGVLASQGMLRHAKSGLNSHSEDGMPPIGCTRVHMALENPESTLTIILDHYAIFKRFETVEARQVQNQGSIFGIIALPIGAGTDRTSRVAISLGTCHLNMFSYLSGLCY